MITYWKKEVQGVSVIIAMQHVLYVYILFSAFSEYNTEQFTPAKVGENQVWLQGHIGKFCC